MSEDDDAFSFITLNQKSQRHCLDRTPKDLRGYFFHPIIYGNKLIGIRNVDCFG